MEFIDPKTDFAFKKIFGSEESKPILISFLNALIYEASPTIQDLTIIDPYQARKVAGLKDSYLDVKATLENGTIVIIEMQVVYKTGFEKRILYNAAKSYSSQLQRGQFYSEIMPVIALTIVNFTLFKNSSKIISRFSFREADEGWEYTYPGLTLIFAELPKLNKPLEELETLGDKWLYFLKQAGTLEVVPESLNRVPEIQRAFTVANRVNLSSEEFDRLEEQSLYLREQQSLQEEKERLAIENQQIAAENQQIIAQNQQITAQNQQITAQNQQITAQKQRLEETNQQLQENLEIAIQKQRNLVFRQLTRRFGSLEETIATAMQQLSNEQLENLGEAMFDFETIEDLHNWLTANL